MATIFKNKMKSETVRNFYMIIVDQWDIIDLGKHNDFSDASDVADEINSWDATWIVDGFTLQELKNKLNRMEILQ